MALTVHNIGSGSGGLSYYPTEIVLTSPPNKTNYWHGETLDLTGMSVKVNFSSGTEKDITNECTTSPANGSALTVGTTNITINWVWNEDASFSFSLTQDITVKKKLTSISVTSPTKTEYALNESLNLAGSVVTAHYNDSTTADVTSKSVFNPANGTKLTDNTTVAVSYTENGINMSSSFSVKVSVKIVTWKDGSDADIKAMVDAADAGKIKLSDYWAVGDERTVTLGSMAATGVGESHSSESVTFVLMNVGGKTLSSGKECSFIVGLKNCLSTTGYMNSSDTNSGGWDKSARRTWCNSVFYNAVPSSFRGIFKQFKNKTGLYESQSTLSETTDWFALPAAKEVYPSYNHASTNNTWFSTTTEWNALSGFSYYNTSANRIKKLGNSGSANWYWLRSPVAYDSSHFCGINSDGNASSRNASSSYGLAPFGCI